MRRHSSLCSDIVSRTSSAYSRRSSCRSRHKRATVAALSYAIASAGLAINASAQINSDYFYNLTTEFRGANMKLDVFNGGAKDRFTHLTSGSFSGHYWEIAGPNSDGFVALRNRFSGHDLCLDIVNGGPQDNQPQMRPCGNFSGQRWKLTPVAGHYRLTTAFRGDNMCLDIFNGGPSNNQPHLTRCDPNLTGQRWQLRKTDLFALAGNARLVTVRRMPVFGGPGGRAFENSCPFGAVLTGIKVRHGAWIDAISPICGFYHSGLNTIVANLSHKPPFNGGNGGGEGHMLCAGPLGVVVGIQMFQANNQPGTIGHLIIDCGDYKDPTKFANKAGGSAPFLGHSQRGPRREVKCAPPLVAGGLIGRAGVYVDALSLACVDYRPR